MTLVTEGTPASNGLYVAYINDEHVRTHAAKRLMMWFDGKWYYPGSDQSYRDHVYGWIGPLPAMELSD